MNDFNPDENASLVALSELDSSTRGDLDRDGRMDGETEGASTEVVMAVLSSTVMARETGEGVGWRCARVRPGERQHVGRSGAASWNAQCHERAQSSG